MSSFSPAADDLDYPGKLQRAAQEAESAAAEAQRDGQDGSEGGDGGEAGAAPEGSDAANKVRVVVGCWGRACWFSRGRGCAEEEGDKGRKRGGKGGWGVAGEGKGSGETQRDEGGETEKGGRRVHIRWRLG